MARTSATPSKRDRIPVARGNRAPAKEGSIRIPDGVPGLIATIGSDLRVRRINRRYGEWLGMAPGRAAGRRVRDLFRASDYREIGPLIHRALAGEWVHFERRMEGAAGRSGWLEGTLIPEAGPDGRVERLHALMVEIGDRKRLEESVRKRDEPFRRLYESNIIGVIFATIHGQIFDCNEAFLEMVGYGREDLPLNWIDMTPPEWLPLDEDAIKQASSRGVVPTWEKEYLRKDGTRVPILLAVAMLDMKAGTCICPVLDLSDRSRLEKALLEQSETERRRLGLDLHDGLGQHLTGLAFLTKALEERLKERAAEEAGEAAKIAGLAEQAVARARSLAQIVSPVNLQGEGFLPAMSVLAANMRNVFDVTCTFKHGPGLNVQDAAKATHLFHIAQEAVTNAIKHGRARRIAIRLAAPRGRLTLTVDDDGIGMPEKPSRHDGMGLGIMRHRARMIGATIEHRRRPRGGTIVVCTIHALRRIRNRKGVGHGNKDEAVRRRSQKENPRRR